MTYLQYSDGQGDGRMMYVNNYMRKEFKLDLTDSP